MNKPDYNRQMKEKMATHPRGTPLFLHACCAPCASQAIARLGEHFALTLYYYNPNIFPEKEYLARRNAFAELIRQASARFRPTFLEGPYEPQHFTVLAAPLAAQREGGPRCALCFSLRLNQTARQAAHLGFPLFTTTLTVGPRKAAAPINELGAAAGLAYGVNFLPADFKKQGGYQNSVALSKRYGLYRQHYCGCPYSFPPGK